MTEDGRPRTDDRERMSRSPVIDGHRSSLPVPGLRSPVFGPRSSVPGPRSSVPGLRSSVPGLRSPVFSPRSPVPGPRSPVFSPRSPVFSQSPVLALPAKASGLSLQERPPNNSPSLLRTTFLESTTDERGDAWSLSRGAGAQEPLASGDAPGSRVENNSIHQPRGSV